MSKEQSLLELLNPKACLHHTSQDGAVIGSQTMARFLSNCLSHFKRCTPSPLFRQPTRSQSDSAAPSALTFFFYFIIIITTVVIISVIISVFIIVVIAWDRFPVLLRLRLRVPVNSYCDYLVLLLLSVRGNPYPRLLLLEPAYPL